MADMKISTGKGKGAKSVTVDLPTPTTFDDPQWAKWNCGEEDICALAVRQIRVDIANGGARDTLRDAVKQFPKDAGKWADAVKTFVGSWKRGVKRTAKRPVTDLRQVPGLTQELVDGLREQNPGTDFLVPEGLE